jgi:hypothetical protein
MMLVLVYRLNYSAVARMATVRSFAERVQNSIDELTSLKSKISDSFDTLSNTDLSKKRTLKQSKESSDLEKEAEMYDRLFEEEEAKLQAFGGKTRAETLQEFVLLFFFVGYGIFTVSIALLAMTTQGTTAALKIVGLMVFCLLLISGLIIRYA